MGRKKVKRLAEADEKPKFRDEIVVQARTTGQKRYIQEIKNNDIIFCCGPAGCGKTVIAVGMALQYVLAPRPAYEKIVIMRPVKEACGETLGYLPGDLGDKMAPWAAPILDNMEVFIDPVQIKNVFYQRKVEIIPMAYARGRSLNRSFIIVDEAQNCNPKQFLMTLTRLGENSKMVINGDVSQSDSSIEGLSDAIRRLQGIQGIATCEMGKDDIVRHRLISQIIEAYAPAPKGNPKPPEN